MYNNEFVIPTSSYLRVGKFLYEHELLESLISTKPAKNNTKLKQSGLSMLLMLLQCSEDIDSELEYSDSELEYSDSELEYSDSDSDSDDKEYNIKQKKKCNSNIVIENYIKK